MHDYSLQPRVRRFAAAALCAVTILGGCAAPPESPSATATSSMPLDKPIAAATAPPVPSATTPPSPTTLPATPTASPTLAPTLSATPLPAPTLVPATPAPSVTPVPPVAAAPTRAVVREFAADFAAGQGKDVAPSADANAFTLARQADGRYLTRGELVSEVRTPGWPFDNVVLSWTANAPAGSGLTFAVRVRVGGEWSGWYTLGVWRGGAGSSVRGQSDAWGKVEVDTLALTRPADGYQYRVSFESTDGAAAPALRSVTVALADMRRQPAGEPVELAPGWQRELAVPAESQAIQEPSVAWSICSPTSLTMILRYWGATVTVPQVYRGVKDATSGIYGNWPLNTAYAAELGFDAYVARMHSLDVIRNHIAAGRPVAVSIKYSAGDLQGAALASTSGHLVLVRGFTPDGKAILNDPAAPGLASVRRVVPADQLERVWLRSGGIAYLVSPQQ